MGKSVHSAMHLTSRIVNLTSPRNILRQHVRMSCRHAVSGTSASCKQAVFVSEDDKTACLSDRRLPSLIPMLDGVKGNCSIGWDKDVEGSVSGRFVVLSQHLPIGIEEIQDSRCYVRPYTSIQRPRLLSWLQSQWLTVHPSCSQNSTLESQEERI
jgi:hypothetical protein